MKKSEFGNVAAVIQQPTTVAKKPTPASYPAYRQGKKAIIFYGPQDMSDELKRLAIDNHVTLQELLIEAANDLLRKYGRHPV